MSYYIVSYKYHIINYLFSTLYNPQHILSCVFAYDELICDDDELINTYPVLGKAVDGIRDHTSLASLLESKYVSAGNDIVVDVDVVCWLFICLFVCLLLMLLLLSCTLNYLIFKLSIIFCSLVYALIVRNIA